MGRIEVRLGDRMNGFVAETNVFLGPTFFPGCKRPSLISTRIRPMPRNSNGGQGPCAAPDLRCTQGGCAGEVSALRVSESELGSDGGDHCLCLHALWGRGGSNNPQSSVGAAHLQKKGFARVRAASERARRLKVFFFGTFPQFRAF